MTKKATYETCFGCCQHHSSVQPVRGCRNVLSPIWPNLNGLWYSWLCGACHTWGHIDCVQRRELSQSGGNYMGGKRGEWKWNSIHACQQAERRSKVPRQISFARPSNACMSDWPCIVLELAERSASLCAFFPLTLVVTLSTEPPLRLNLKLIHFRWIHFRVGKRRPTNSAANWMARLFFIKHKYLFKSLCLTRVYELMSNISLLVLEHVATDRSPVTLCFARQGNLAFVWNIALYPLSLWQLFPTPFKM